MLRHWQGTDLSKCGGICCVSDVSVSQTPKHLGSLNWHPCWPLTSAPIFLHQPKAIRVRIFWVRLAQAAGLNLPFCFGRNTPLPLENQRLPTTSWALSCHTLVKDRKAKLWALQLQGKHVPCSGWRNTTKLNLWSSRPKVFFWCTIRIYKSTGPAHQSCNHKQIYCGKTRLRQHAILLPSADWIWAVLPAIPPSLAKSAVLILLLQTRYLKTLRSFCLVKWSVKSPCAKKNTCLHPNEPWSTGLVSLKAQGNAGATAYALLKCHSNDKTC
jgi:hypothetical protein